MQLQSPPPHYSSWKAFYNEVNDGFQENAGIQYEGVLYPWQTIKKFVALEAGLPEPFDESVRNLSFDCKEGQLEIKYEQDWDSGKISLRITGYLIATSRSSSEIWVRESYESSLATDRRFRTFDQEQANYMMKRLIHLHSIA